jgi:germination protein M
MGTEDPQAGDLSEDWYQIYYTDRDEKKLLSFSWEPTEVSSDSMMQELISRLNQREARADGHGLLPAQVQINSYSINDSVLSLEFSDSYHELDPSREILLRAGIVRTFLQVPGIVYVQIFIGSSELTDRFSQPIGPMNLTDFAQFDAKSSQAYRHEVFTVYYTDKDGASLYPETRSVYYRKNLPREQIILETLAKGPLSPGHYPTITENIVIHSAEVFDGVCFLDLGSSFLEYAPDIPPETMIGSIIASLAQNTDIQRLQILINGEADVTIKPDFSLYRFFTVDPLKIAQS